MLEIGKIELNSAIAHMVPAGISLVRRFHNLTRRGTTEEKLIIKAQRAPSEDMALVSVSHTEGGLLMTITGNGEIDYKKVMKHFREHGDHLPGHTGTDFYLAQGVK